MAAALDALVPEAEQTARRKILASGVVSPCPTANRVNRPAVIDDPDIFRAAKLLIDQRGNGPGSTLTVTPAVAVAAERWQVHVRP